MSAPNELDIFVNCPFDDEYKPFFYATIFVITRYGYRARCALEADNAAENRLSKIEKIIEQCPFGIHDISRTESSGDLSLPRFNMPFELGLFLGARRYGSRLQRKKSCIVFDRERYRYQQFISDIAGQDIHSHDGQVEKLIAELAGWLRQQPGGARAPGGEAITHEYREFDGFLPEICAGRGLQLHELTFGDFNETITQYVAERF